MLQQNQVCFSTASHSIVSVCSTIMFLSKTYYLRVCLRCYGHKEQVFVVGNEKRNWNREKELHPLKANTTIE